VFDARGVSLAIEQIQTQDRWIGGAEMTHSRFPWQLHPLVPTSVFDADGKRIIWDAPEGWQDMETAPRDGESMLATGGGLGDSVQIVSYGEHVCAWETSEVLLDDRDDEADGYSRPTHWQPLPAPPSDKPAPTPLDPETAADNAALIAGVGEMVAALQPFAEAFDRIPARDRDLEGIDEFNIERVMYVQYQPKVGDLRRAKAALASVGRVK
jgi:hypothetical protein